ncbi:MAG TPA: hypothetical protein VK886_03285 [Vicinamibacterales bacterium]|nr:hypothetical protein [Vicinamibacterales bacterium]
MDAINPRSRRKVVWGIKVAVAVLLSSFLFGGCGKAVRQGRGAADLVLEALEGASGATPDEMSHTLASDVITLVEVDEVKVPTIYEDPGRAQFRVVMKDIGGPSSVTSPSSNNWITLTRYRVVFLRADGRNTPGVDVPYPFDGAATQTITGAVTQMGFILVRAQAKNEAPLRALVGFGGANLISTIAEVTFYGHDVAGNAVSVTGRMSVNFADWGDPE